jgi:hypothetical protein
VRLLVFAAGCEVIVGLVLIASPSFVTWLLLGAPLAPSGEVIGRVAGFGLLGLGVACLPQGPPLNRRSLAGLLTYNVLAALFFLYLGIRHELVGVLLWPGAAFHATLSVLLSRLLPVSKTI